MHEKERKCFFHKVDLFHTITLGMGKSYAASSLAMLQEVLPGSSIDERMGEMSALYIEYCKDPCFCCVSFLTLHVLLSGQDL